MDPTTEANHSQGGSYEVDRASGRVQFGNGVRGRRLPPGKNTSADGERPRPKDEACGPLQPFERNNYFLGKVLTADDLQAEQEYVNAKRRLLNRLIHGVGVLCGLTVRKQQGSRLTITAGVALDGCGREIVVPHDVTIDLTEHLPRRDGKKAAYVWLQYAEWGVDPVPTVGSADDAEEQAYSRIKESYHIGVGWDRTNDRAHDGPCHPRSHPGKRLNAAKDHAVILARVHVTTKKGALTIHTLDEAPRKTVYSHEQLYEAIQGLRKQIAVFRRQKMTCPHCNTEFEG
jgi:hypothetical protein